MDQTVPVNNSIPKWAYAMHLAGNTKNLDLAEMRMYFSEVCKRDQYFVVTMKHHLMLMHHCHLLDQLQNVKVCNFR